MPALYIERKKFLKSIDLAPATRSKIIKYPTCSDINRHSWHNNFDEEESQTAPVFQMCMKQFSSISDSSRKLPNTEGLKMFYNIYTAISNLKRYQPGLS